MADWKPDGAPFCWQPKEAFRRIEQSLELSQAATAKLLYLALARIASDEGVCTFTKPINYIATMASVNRRTIERRLPDLEKLELVAVQRSKLHTAHRYTLTTLSRNPTTQSRNDATGTSPLRVALSREQENKRREAPRKLGTADRIGLEHQAELLRQKIEEHKDAGYYEHDRTPDWKPKLDALKSQLKAVEVQLLGGVQ